MNRDGTSDVLQQPQMGRRLSNSDHRSSRRTSELRTRDQNTWTVTGVDTILLPCGKVVWTLLFFVRCTLHCPSRVRRVTFHGALFAPTVPLVFAVYESHELSGKFLFVEGWSDFFARSSSSDLFAHAVSIPGPCYTILLNTLMGNSLVHVLQEASLLETKLVSWRWDSPASLGNTQTRICLVHSG